MTEHPLILVFYIDVGNIPPNDVQRYMNKIVQQMQPDNKFKESNRETYFIPIREGDSRVECLNPQILTEKQIAATRNQFTELQDVLQGYIKELKEAK